MTGDRGRPRSGRDTFVTLYGRMPVLEALQDDRVVVDRVLVARSAHGDSVDDIVRAAADRGVPVQRVAPEKVTRLSGNGRHDQGVVADVVVDEHQELDDWLSGRPGPPAVTLFVLDAVTNPANVGMVIRSVTASGVGGVVLPRVGVPDVGPLVVKASAGVALRALVLRSPTTGAALASLRAAGFVVVGLDAARGVPVYDLPVDRPLAFVLGNETKGISSTAAAAVDEWTHLPMHGGVESLNVACTASVVAYEVARRRAERGR